MSIYVTSDAIYLDQGNEIIKLADIGSNSSASSVKSNNSGELL